MVTLDVLGRFDLSLIGRLHPKACKRASIFSTECSLNMPQSLAGQEIAVGSCFATFMSLAIQHWEVMMFSATMSAETRALCKKSLGLTRWDSGPATNKTSPYQQGSIRQHYTVLTCTFYIVESFESPLLFWAV